MFKKNKSSLFKKVMLTIFGILLANGIYLTCLKYNALYQLKKSRDGKIQSINSFEFLSRNVRYGMSEKEVDSLMQGADKVIRHMGSPDPDGHTNHYHFYYGRTYRGLFVGAPEKLCTEIDIVYFDKELKAISMLVLINKSYGRSFEYHIDLENSTFQKK